MAEKSELSAVEAYGRRVVILNVATIIAFIGTVAVIALWLHQLVYGLGAVFALVVIVVTVWVSVVVRARNKTRAEFGADLADSPEPPSYGDRKRHLKFLWRNVAGYQVIFGLTVWLIIALRMDQAATALAITGTLLVNGWFVLRRAWIRGRRRVTYDAEGQMIIVSEAPNILLLLFGSKPEQYPMDRIALSTPTQSFLDMLFDTHTVWVGGRKFLTDLVDYHFIKAIYDWGRRLEARSTRAEEAAAEIARQQLESSRRAEAWLEKLVQETQRDKGYTPPF